MPSAPTAESLWRELVVFLALCLLVWPVIAAALVGAYGVGWWIYLALAGAPGPA